MPNIVFAMGAGASKAAGLPLYSDILSLDYIDSLSKRKMNSSEGKDILLKDLLPTQVKFLKYVAAEAEKNGTRFFEELLDRAYREQPIYQDFLSYYYTLILLAQYTTRHTQETKKPCDNPYIDPYVEFAALLDKIKEQNEVTIITFNHDVLIEQGILWEEFSYVGDNSKCYGIPSSCTAWQCPDKTWLVPLDTTLPHKIVKIALNYWAELQKKQQLSSLLLPAPAIKSGNDPLKLYKLHGSFNQLVCPQCGGLFWGYGELISPKIIEPFGPLKCHICNQELANSIIPPRKAKEIVGLKNIWDSASEALLLADVLYFVGYSLPEYDEDANKLFEKTNEDCAVFVYTKSARQELVTRFKEILPQSKILLGGFEQLINDLFQKYISNGIY